LFLALPFLAIGILGLSSPLLVELPDYAPFMWDLWTPDGKHLGRYRMTQIFAGPAFLWMSGVFLASIVCALFTRPRSQEMAGATGGVPSTGAGGGTPAGVHPWIYTLGLYIILGLVTLRMVVSR
jgi:hypothetical protein